MSLSCSISFSIAFMLGQSLSSGEIFLLASASLQATKGGFNRKTGLKTSCPRRHLPLSSPSSCTCSQTEFLAQASLKSFAVIVAASFSEPGVPPFVCALPAPGDEDFLLPP